MFMTALIIEHSHKFYCRHFIYFFLRFAGVVIGAHNREGLQRLCRDVARPPLSSKRLHIQPNGQILIRLKRAWMDGTQHLELSPIEWLEKLAALVPPPRVNQVLVHGVLAPRAKWRQEIVPKPSEPEAFKPLRKCANHSPRRRHALWAELLWNSFGVDGWACFQWGEHMSLRAVVIHPPATTKVLQGLGGRGLPKVGPMMKPGAMG